MTEAKLRPFTRLGLDILFVALSRPQQSDSNDHYFSGNSSELLLIPQAYSSRLIRL